MTGVPIVEPLGREDCLVLLGRLRWGRVALTMDAMPAIRSVRFALHDGDIRFWVSKGSRLHRAASGAVVAFHADSIDEPAGEASSIQVRGIAHPVSHAGGGDPVPPPWSGVAGADQLLGLSTYDLAGERVRWSGP